MDILIKGMEMPKEIQCCYTIFPDGKVIVHWDGKVLGEAKAIELPPHGDLIDRNETMQSVLDKKFSTSRTLIDSVLNVIKDAPTILEASND